MTEDIKRKRGRPRKYFTPEELREGRRLLQKERRMKKRLASKLLSDSSSEQKQE